MHPFNCYVYFHQLNKLTILFVEGLGYKWPIVEYLNDRTYIFNIVPWNLKRDHLKQYFDQWSEGKDHPTCFNFKQQVIWLMNTREQVEWAEELGIAALFVNHNCWLDHTLFKINNQSEDRPYSLVVNARPFDWKRVYLADAIESLAYIKGADYTQGEKWSWSPFYRLYQYINLKPVKELEKINQILNRSKIGGIFSGNTGEDQQGNFEGACYSSSEFLLAGLPVISTPSEGGRDVWYTDRNSVICQPTREEVYEAYKKILARMENGEINREDIRETHIRQQIEMREVFIHYTKQIFEKHNLEIDGDQLFRERFINKMTCYNSDPKTVIETVFK